MQRREVRRQASKKSFKPSLRLSLQSEQKDCDKTQQNRRSPEANTARGLGRSHGRCEEMLSAPAAPTDASRSISTPHDLRHAAAPSKTLRRTTGMKLISSQSNPPKPSASK
jgi:hypothetical protein